MAVRDTPRGVEFTVKVHPRAKRDAITGTLGNAWKLALTAPPVDGKANDAVVRYLAELLDISRASVTIASGETSRQKLIRVTGLRADDVRAKLDAAVRG